MRWAKEDLFFLQAKCMMDTRKLYGRRKSTSVLDCADSAHWDGAGDVWTQLFPLFWTSRLFGGLFSWTKMKFVSSQTFWLLDSSTWKQQLNHVILEIQVPVFGPIGSHVSSSVPIIIIIIIIRARTSIFNIILIKKYFFKIF